MQGLNPAYWYSRQGDAFYWTAKTSNSQAITLCLNGSCLTINHWDKVPEGSHLFSYEYRQGTVYACACICKWERQAKYCIHVSQKRHALCCINVCDEQCWWVHWLCSINILCHASAERWELLASGLMSITPPCSVKEGWKKHSCLNSREDVLIIIPNCKGTSHDLHPCYFQAKDRRLQAPLWEWFHLSNVIDLKCVWLAEPLFGLRVFWGFFYREHLVWCPVPIIKGLFKMDSVTLIVEFRIRIEHFPHQSPHQAKTHIYKTIHTYSIHTLKGLHFTFKA